VLNTEVAALRAEQPEAVPEDLVGALVSGLAAHHAGCLPAWKSLIERCFQRGAPLSFVPALLCQEMDVHASITVRTLGGTLRRLPAAWKSLNERCLQ